MEGKESANPGPMSEEQKNAAMQKVMQLIAQHASVIYQCIPPGGVAEINFTGSKIITPGRPQSAGKLILMRPASGFAVNVEGGGEG
jgi:hypothetical protein